MKIFIFGAALAVLGGCAGEISGPFPDAGPDRGAADMAHKKDGAAPSKDKKVGDDSKPPADKGKPPADQGKPKPDKAAPPPDKALPKPDLPTGKTCPASKTVTLKKWQTSGWKTPSSGTAQSEFLLSKENYKHYRSLDLKFEMDVGKLDGDYNCWIEVRNRAVPKSWKYYWRYFAICNKNKNPKKLVWVIFATKNGYLTKSFTMKKNTTYSVHANFDAAANSAFVKLTEKGGATTTITGPASSSIVPVGQGLRLLVGFDVKHPDYPTIKPPWGWTFRDLVLTMTPGGPFGPEAPPCP